MDDWWDGFEPNEGDFGISFCEAAHDVAVFFGKVIGAVIVVAVVIVSIAYGIWRELAIFAFLTGL